MGAQLFPWIGFAVFAKFAQRLCWFLSREHVLKNIRLFIGISCLLKVLSTGSFCGIDVGITSS
jgi:hypothetical protein